MVSYDYWVIGFTTLGYSFFISELQNRDKKLEYKNMIMMNICFLLGIAPKAIYFVLMFVLLFMPKDKFVDKKQRKIYYTLIVGVAVFLMMTFLLPMLIGSSGTGDTRGGEDVNSIEQIKYILSNPGEYTGTLLNFLKEYLDLDYEKKIKMPCVRGAYFFSAAVCIILVATALYVSFTEVGANYIAGCQPRYLLPILFPTAYFIGVDGVQTKINKNVMTVVSISIMSYFFMAGMWNTCF